MSGPARRPDATLHFTSPLLCSDPRLARFMMGEYAGALVEIALSRCDTLLRTWNRSLLDRVHEVIARPLPWSVTWTPALAELESHLVSSMSPSAVWATLAPLLVRFGAEGILPDADIQLDPVQAVHWGSLRLPAANRISFRHTRTGATVELYRSGIRRRTLSLRRASRDLWTSDEAETLPIAWLGRYPVLLESANNGTPYPLPSGRRLLADALARTEVVFADAARFLAKYCPTFLPWVGDAVRSVVPLDASDSIRLSATVERFPGLVFLSLPADPIEVAARLVHEASHQYFFALQRLARLHDGTDKKEYFSPIKGRGRSIDLILFAFHAFGNGVLFHRALHRKDQRFTHVIGQTLDAALTQLRVLDSHLSETRALTPMGELLWRPLASRLFDGARR